MNPHSNNEHAQRELVTRMFKEYDTRIVKEFSEELIKKEFRGCRQEFRDNLCYGEISFECMRMIFSEYVGLDRIEGGVFYDLGSGVGKQIYTTSLLHSKFDKIIGIELIKGLYDISQSILSLHSHVQEFEKIKFVNDDFLKVDWSDGDVIFANSTCFDKRLMKRLATKGRDLRPGAYFITFTKSLKSIYFDIKSTHSHKMSWGYATLYIHQRSQTPSRSNRK